MSSGRNDVFAGARTVDLDGPVAYVEWPSERPDRGGPTFVCVHGLGGSHLNWMLVGPRLAGYGRVLALDLAGFGLTPRDGRSSSVAANRRLLSRFVQEMTDGPVILVGNSMGGALSILQAAYEPRSAAGLVLTSPALPWSRRARPPAALVLATFAIYQMPRVVMADPKSVPVEVVEAHVELARRRADDPDSVPAFLQAARSLLTLGGRRPFVGEVLDRVKVPVLVVHGRKDRLVRVQVARAAARNRDTWEVEELDGVGHAAQLEAPDRWMDALIRWLDRTGLDAAAAEASTG
jgi:pimeloyl-ACP methyl ester carboxylesterase